MADIVHLKVHIGDFKRKRSSIDFNKYITSCAMVYNNTGTTLSYIYKKIPNIVIHGLHFSLKK